LQALITLAAFLLTLGVLVSFHEFGHFLAARCCGVRVLRFAIGFGKPLFTYVAANKTEWVIASIPLGGYVKLLDGRDRQQSIVPAEESEAFDPLIENLFGNVLRLLQPDHLPISFWRFSSLLLFIFLAPLNYQQSCRPPLKILWPRNWGCLRVIV